MSRLGLNIDLDDVARRLSFSPASPPQMPPRASRFRVVTELPPIPEDPREQQAASATQTPACPSPWVSSPSQAPFSAPQTASFQRPATFSSRPPVYPSPVHTQVVPVSPAPSGPPSQTQQQQQVAAALGKLEQTRQAGLQQAWAAAQQQQQALASAFRGWEQGRQAGLQQSWAVPQPQQAVAAAAAALAELEQGRLPGSQQSLAQPYPEPPPQQLRLYTVEGEPAGYKTKWEQLHPVSQQLLLQIEDKLREDRHAREELDQCSRLYDPSVLNNSYERDARQISQEIGSISTIMDREKASIQSLMLVVRESMSTVEFAMGSYVKLRQRFVSRGAGIANTGFANRAGSSGTPADVSQPVTMGRTFSTYHGSVRRPSIFMQRIVDRFENQLEECCKMIGELEQLIQMKHNKTYPPSLECLPKVMSNMHDYFIYVASKVENLHQCAETIRIHHLNDLRNSGNRNDPFAEADRKEGVKQEAAARTVHPTLPFGDPIAVLVGGNSCAVRNQ